MRSYSSIEMKRIKYIICYSLAVSCVFFLFNMYATSILFYIGLAGLLLSMVAFSEKELFLMISFFIPNLFMFKQIGSDAAILGYFFALLGVKEFVKSIKTRVRVNLMFVAHIIFTIITCCIYSDQSLFVSLIRFAFNFSLFSYYASLFSNDGEIKQVVKMYCAGVIAAIVMGIIFRSSRGVLFNGRFGGVNSGRNFFGAVVTPTITFVVLYFLEKKVSFKETVLYGATTVLCFISVVLSGSRTSVLCLTIPLLMYLWYLFASFSKFYKKLIPLALLFALLAIVVYIKYQDSIDFVISRFGEDDIKTGNGRFDLWKYYGKQVLTSPITFLFGNGSVYENFPGQVEHNTIVQCLYQLGAVGLITLFSFIWQTFRKINKGKKIRFIAFFPLLSVIVPYFGISALYSDQFSFLLILCAIIMRDVSRSKD